jgi:hypothetical protein
MAVAHILVGHGPAAAGESLTAAQARFQERVRSLGLAARPLALTLLRQGEGHPPLLRVAWQKTVTIRVLGWRVRITFPQWGRFTFYPVHAVIGTVEAERLASQVAAMPEVDEVGVLVEEKVDPILAVRIGERWYECYRWLRRPYIILPEEAAPLPTCLSFYRRVV